MVRLTQKNFSAKSAYAFASLDQRASQRIVRAAVPHRFFLLIPYSCFNVRTASRAISHVYHEAFQLVGMRRPQYSSLVAISYVNQVGDGELAETLPKPWETNLINMRISG